MAAKAKMKYHHLERCFTNRVKRPVVSRGLRAPGLLGLGLSGGNPTFTRGQEGHLCPACPRLGQPRHREYPTVANTAPSVFPSGELVASLVSRHLPDGSLAGAAYLLHDNAGVLRKAQWEQNSHVEHKRKGLLD